MYFFNDTTAYASMYFDAQETQVNVVTVLSGNCNRISCSVLILPANNKIFPKPDISKAFIVLLHGRNKQKLSKGQKYLKY